MCIGAATGVTIFKNTTGKKYHRPGGIFYCVGLTMARVQRHVTESMDSMGFMETLLFMLETEMVITRRLCVRLN